jgi:hypothetical protein
VKILQICKKNMTAVGLEESGAFSLPLVVNKMLLALQRK